MPILSKTKALAPARDRFKTSITLLSHGYVDPVAFPEGKLTVYPWDSAADEFLVNRAKKGKKETILFDLFPRLCNLNGCPARNFLASEALLVVMISRALTRNSEITMEIVCPECSHTWSETINIPSGLEKLGEKSAEYPGYTIVTLPDSGDMVKFHSSTVQDQIDILNRPPEMRKAPMTDGVANILACVDAVAPTEKELIDGFGKPDNIMEAAEWYTRLSPKDVSILGEAIDKSNPQLGTVLSVACPECSHEFKFSLSLDEHFFRGASR